MPSEGEAAVSDPTLSSHQITTSPNPWRLWFQIVTILALTQPFYSPTGFLLSRFLFPALPESFAGEWLYSTVYELILVGIALGMMWLSGEPWSVFGIKKPQWSTDLISSFLIMWADLAVMYVGADLLHGILVELLGAKRLEALSQQDGWGYPPEGLSGIVALSIYSFAIAFAEELVTRGYLISRLQHLFHSNVASIVISAVVFGAFHANNGVISVGVNTMVGLVLGTAFVLSQRLWPVVIAHALVDLHVFLYDFN